jgi:hypothetical protein
MSFADKVNEVILSESEINESVTFAELISLGLELGRNDKAQFELIMIENELIEYQPTFS